MLIAGEGPLKSSLRELAAKLQLHDVVTFADTPADPRELLEVMDVFVLPHTREGMSPLVLEAMALGKPVAVSGAGGTFAAVQHNHTGVVFGKGDAEALADAVLRLVIKPDFSARLVAAARDLVAQKFSIDRMMDETVSLYRKLIGKHKVAVESAD